MQHSAERHGAAQWGTARHGTAWFNTWRGMAQGGATRRGAAQHGMAQRDAARRGAAWHSATRAPLGDQAVHIRGPAHLSSRCGSLCPHQLHASAAPGRTPGGPAWWPGAAGCVLGGPAARCRPGGGDWSSGKGRLSTTPFPHPPTAASPSDTAASRGKAPTSVALGGAVAQLPGSSCRQPPPRHGGATRAHVFPADQQPGAGSAA